MTYYLKYRPKTLLELDIAEVRDSLTKIVASGKIPHAFLFSGPKGTGKTSAARILAKIINCESKNTPCNKCEQCISIAAGNNLDVIELDAASHRGIEDIRSLRDAVKLAPAKAKKKVYTIDEAHMLTTEAGNAFLKTLEEPPKHVVFILATTNPEKLLETVKSRVVNIVFRKARGEEVVRSLLRIVKGEKLKIDKEALLLIAKAAQGSFRDAAKILEQLVTEKRSLKASDLEEYLFKNKSLDVMEFMQILINRNVTKALDYIERLIEKGIGVEQITDSVLQKLHGSLLAKSGIGDDDFDQLVKDQLVYLIELMQEARVLIKNSPIEQLPLEVAIVKWCGDEDKETEKEKVQKLTGNLKEVNGDVWKKILTTVRPINASIEAFLRAARPLGLDGDNLHLGVYYRFHKEKLEESHHLRILEEVVGGVLGFPVKISCSLTPPEGRVLTESEDKDIMKIAEEIFNHV